MGSVANIAVKERVEKNVHKRKEKEEKYNTAHLGTTWRGKQDLRNLI